MGRRGFRRHLSYFRENEEGRGHATARALETGKGIFISDIDTDDSYVELRDIARSAGYRALHAVPIIGSDGKPLGVLSTHFALSTHPDDQHLDRLALYAKQAASFVERCRLDNARQQLIERIRACGESNAVSRTGWLWRQSRANYSPVIPC